MVPSAQRLAVLVPLALLAACGGSDDDKGTGLSKAEYVSRAEAICTRANAAVKAEAFPTSPAALPGYVEALLAIADKATKEVVALEPPVADQADLQAKVLTPLEGQITEGRAYLAKIKVAVATNDQKELGRLLASPPASSKADLDWMRGYGFKACVESADTKG